MSEALQINTSSLSLFLPSTVSLLRMPQGQMLNPPFHLLSLGLLLSPHPIVLPPLFLPFPPTTVPFLFFIFCWKHLPYLQESALHSLLRKGNKCFRFMSFVWFINVQEKPAESRLTALLHGCMCASKTQQFNYFTQKQKWFTELGWYLNKYCIWPHATPTNT